MESTQQAKPKEETPKQTQAPKQEAKPKEETPKQKQKPKVDPVKYNRYTELKLLDLAKAKLPDEVKKELKELEVELKKCSGKIPIRTVTAALGNEKCVLIEGIPVTEEIEKFIQDENDDKLPRKSNKYYFGK